MIPKTTFEVHERYEVDLAKREWWEDNMPAGAKYNPTYNYRRTTLKIDDVEKVVEIPDNKKECKLKMYAGYSITIMGNYDVISIEFNDLCNGMIEQWEEEN